MGFFDDLVGKVVSVVKNSQDQQGGIAKGVLGLLINKDTGGLEGLIKAFNQKGLGEIASSWVGTGSNLSITPEQVQEVLGSDVIQQLAEKSGLSFEAAKSQFADLLPSLIDGLTPEGKIPEEGILDKSLELLQGKFSKTEGT